jgi:hypothetical protein
MMEHPRIFRFRQTKVILSAGLCRYLEEQSDINILLHYAPILLRGSVKGIPKRVRKKLLTAEFIFYTRRRGRHSPYVKLTKKALAILREEGYNLKKFKYK